MSFPAGHVPGFGWGWEGWGGIVMEKIDQFRDLSEEDTASQTLGCRHSNPDNCSRNSMVGVCAFVKGNNICTSPPMSWKGIYQKLILVKKNSSDSI
jgi:hypothetical protein